MTQILGTTIFAYVVGVLVATIFNVNPVCNYRSHELQVLNEFLQDVNSTFMLRRSVRLHFIYDQKKKIDVLNEMNLIDSMPPELRWRVVNFVFGKTLIDMPMLCTLEWKLRGW